MPRLEVHLFGKFLVQRGERSLDTIEARKVRELFCYLLLHWKRPHPREALAELLWRDSLGTQSRKNLRQTLWQLQAVLNSQDQSEPLLLVENDWVQLNPKSDLWLDVAIFEQTFALVQGVSGQDLDLPRIHMLEEAVQLYRGDLLEGWYEEWCIYERERLHNMYLVMLDKLMDYCETQEDFETGLIYGLRILCHDRTRERTHRRMMRLHYLAGDRASALRQYERCTTILQEELGIKPAKRTLEVYQQIRADQLSSSNLTLVAAEPPIEIVIPPPLPDLLNNLLQLRRVLRDVEQQLEQSIRAMETVLHLQPKQVALKI